MKYPLAIYFSRAYAYSIVLGLLEWLIEMFNSRFIDSYLIDWLRYRWCVCYARIIILDAGTAQTREDLFTIYVTLDGQDYLSALMFHDVLPVYERKLTERLHRMGWTVIIRDPTRGETETRLLVRWRQMLLQYHGPADKAKPFYPLKQP